MAFLVGTPNNDLIYGTNDGDTISGLAGNDTLYGLEEDDSINGTAGSDIIFGGPGNDILHGGRGNDTVYGGKGHDILWGDRGQDFLIGGYGNDLFVLDNRDTAQYDLNNADCILDFSNGNGLTGNTGLGRDLLGLTGGLTYDDLSIYNGTGNFASDVIIQDKLTGKYLAVIKNIDASVFTSADFTTSIIPLIPSQSNIPGAGGIGGGPVIAELIPTPTPTPSSNTQTGSSIKLPTNLGGFGGVANVVPSGPYVPPSATPLADLTVTKTSSANPVPINSTLTYTITISNVGNADASNVSLIDNIPAGLTNISVSSNDFVGVTLNGNTLQLNNATLKAGASGVITVTATTPNFQTTLVNTVTVDPSNLVPESNENNNSSTNTTTVGGGFLVNPCGPYVAPAASPGYFTPPTAAANDVYVNSATGNDGNVGTSGAPVKTIQQALTLAGTGGKSSVIRLAGNGTAFPYDSTNASGNIPVNKAVTILGPNAGISPITGSRVQEAVLAAPLYLDDAPPGVKILGLTFDGSLGGVNSNFNRGAKSAPYTEGAIFYRKANGANGSKDNLVIQDNRIVNLHNSGISLNAINAGDPTVSNIRIIDNFIDGAPFTVTANPDPAIFDRLSSGILLWNTNNAEITNNVVQGFDQGIILDTNSNTNVKFNKVANNNLLGLQAAALPVAAGGKGGSQTNLQVSANKFINNNNNFNNNAGRIANVTSAGDGGAIVLSYGYNGTGNEICGNDIAASNVFGVNVLAAGGGAGAFRAATSLTGTMVESNNFYNSQAAINNGIGSAFQLVSGNYFAPGVNPGNVVDAAPSILPYAPLPPF